MNNTIIVAVGVFAVTATLLYAVGRIGTWMWTEDDDLDDDDDF